jgi:anaerobic ribonucleoside-triphosphate reductase activating protein
MKYIAVTSPDINNGLGCRATLWVSGCSRHCKGCQNPETWEYNQGKELSDAWKEISDALTKEYIKGLSISGGDPFSQTDEDMEDLYKLLVDVKRNFPQKDIWLYAGEYYEEAIENPVKKKILGLCDVMVDGPYIYQQKDTSLPFRGSRNQHIIDLKNIKDVK